MSRLRVCRQWFREKYGRLVSVADDVFFRMRGTLGQRKHVFVRASVWCSNGFVYECVLVLHAMRVGVGVLHEVSFELRVSNVGELDPGHVLGLPSSVLVADVELVRKHHLLGHTHGLGDWVLVQWLMRSNEKYRSLFWVGFCFLQWIP